MSYINKVRIDMQVYDLNLKHVGDENLTLVKEEMLNFEFNIFDQKMIFLGLKNARKNSRAVVMNVTKNRLQTMQQRAINFWWKKSQGEFKK